LIKLCVGIGTDLNKDSKQPNLNPNQKAAQLQASCGFETSKFSSSTVSSPIIPSVLTRCMLEVIIPTGGAVPDRSGCVGCTYPY